MLIEYPIVEKNTGAFANIGRQELKEFTRFFLVFLGFRLRRPAGEGYREMWRLCVRLSA